MRLFFALATACTLAQAQTAPEPFKASAPLALELRNVQWFDGQAFKRGTLYVSEGVFTAQKPKRVNRRMELKGQFLIPPLAEAHNYNLQTEWGVAHYAQRYLQDGVFYASMLCSDPAELVTVRPKLSTEASPDVLFASACIAPSDGQPLASLLQAPKARLQDIADKSVLIMDKPEQVEQKWKLVAPRKPDWVKIAFSYSERPELRKQAEQRGKLGLDADTAAAIVRHAHQSGLRVTAHVDSAADFDAALRAGVDQIAHMPGYFNHLGDPPERYLLGADAVALAARQKTAVVTGTAATTLFKTTPEQLDALRQVQTRNLLLLKTAGVPLLLGSDVFTGTALLELRNLAGLAAFSNAELLRLATVDTARALFPKRQLGCFEPGCEASFLLLAANPLLDMEAVGRPMLRVKQGRILTQLADVAESSDDSSVSTETAARKTQAKKSTRPKTKANAKPKKAVSPAKKS